MQPQASLIIPIRAKKVGERELLRLDELLACLPSGYEVIIVNDGSPGAVGKWIDGVVAKHHYSARPITSLHLRTRFKKFSLARARNRGAKAATTPVTLFHDVDFLGAPSVYQRLLNHIKEQELATRPENFFCVPVAFLTEQATQHFISELKQNKEAWCFRQRERLPLEHMQFLVQGSSCIVTNRDDLLSMGGHDEGFKGHGAEDFELLHRLACRFPIAEKPPEYERNMGSGNITEYRGFRAYFSLYGEQCRQAGCTLVHLWHPKRKGFGYYRHKQNFKRLQVIMQNSPKEQCQPSKTIDPQQIWAMGDHV